MGETIILGAGISGLTAAWALRRQGVEPVLLEAGDRPGGKIRTAQRDGFQFEHGPNALQGSAELAEIFDGVGLSERIVAGAPQLKKRFVVHKGELVAMPTSLGEAFKTPLFSKGALLRLAGEPFRKKGSGPQESVTRFVSRRMGPEMARLIDALALGVFAGDPDELAIGYAFPKVYRLEAEHGSLIRGAIKLRRARKTKSLHPIPPLLSFPGGLSEMVTALAEPLDIQLGNRVSTIEKDGDDFLVRGHGPDGDFERRTRRLISALPIHVVRDALKPLGDLQPLEKIRHAQVAVVNLGVRRDQLDHPLDGFGFLAPHREGRLILGAIFASTLFGGRAPDEDHVVLTVMVGGRRRPEILELEDGQIVEQVLWELQHLLGLSGEPAMCDIVRWSPGIPQAEARLADAHAAAHRLEAEHPGLTFLGDWISGVGVPKCMQEAWNVTP